MIRDEAVDPVLAHLNAHYRPDVAADLLAATQPLMAIAWDEGADAAWGRSNEGFNGSYPNPGESFNALPNPYRKPNAD